MQRIIYVYGNAGEKELLLPRERKCCALKKWPLSAAPSVVVLRSVVGVIEVILGPALSLSHTHTQRERAFPFNL